MTLISFSGCNDTTQVEQSVEVENTTVDLEEYHIQVTTMSQDYEELWNTWYSTDNIVAFTNDGEVYFTNYNISYCVSGTYTIDGDTINTVIDTSTIKDNRMRVFSSSYKFKFVDGNLILTLADNETQSLTYYLDKSVALGQSD